MRVPAKSGTSKAYDYQSYLGQTHKVTASYIIDCLQMIDTIIHVASFTSKLFLDERLLHHFTKVSLRLEKISQAKAGIAESLSDQITKAIHAVKTIYHSSTF